MGSVQPGRTDPPDLDIELAATSGHGPTHAEDDYVMSFGDSRLQHGTERGSAEWTKCVRALADVLDKSRKATVNHKGDAASSVNSKVGGQTQI